MTEQLDLFRSAPDDAHLPPDQADRSIVAEALSETLFVEAGAGSGKTSALVNRVVNLVRSGIEIGNIAAITFTEKAAAELRHRIRTALAAVPDHGLEDDGLADIDHAPIGTLHAFARRLLSEFPIEVGLPPRFTVLDEVQSATAFNDRFTDFLETLLADEASARLVQLCQFDRFGIEFGVRKMAEDFQANWDLVEQRVSPDQPPPTVVAITDLAGRCADLGRYSAPPLDTQVKVIDRLATIAAALTNEPDLGETLSLIEELCDLKAARSGNATNWQRHHRDQSVLEEYRSGLALLAEHAQRQRAELLEERRLLLGALLREFTLSSAAERRAAGELEFHDLLVLARKLVALHPHAREALHQRYTRVLLDEFQDTDPIQLELAVRITAAPDLDPVDWRELQPLPGRLCVVGDPKQSIYRFRRADIAQFLSARQQIGAKSATLSANFRSSPAVIDWVNQTMGELIKWEPDVQPAYVALSACRNAPDSPGSVTVLGAQPHDDLGPAGAEELRRREAVDVANVIVKALTERWPIVDSSGPTSRVRPCNAGDIAVLLPARTSLTVLQSELTARGITYRAENSSLVYAAPEIRSLMLAFRAADDPTDELAIVSVLRSPLFGCSDRHLYEWKVVNAQRWGWRDPIPEALIEHPVGIGLSCLGRLAEQIVWTTPSQLLAWLIEERCVMELALAQPGGRDAWRRLRFVVDQARAWSEAGGHGTRGYLMWTRLQGDDGRFIAETVLPETDHDAVRVLTVHAAKGLEFPITIVSGMSTMPMSRRGRRVVWPPDSWTLSDPDDPTYQQFAPVDEQMGDAERMRLLYVAVTRAQDHLVVSLHRGAKPNGSSAWLLADACAGARQHHFEGCDAPLPGPSWATSELPWADETDWAERLNADLAAASRRVVLSATALAEQFADDPALHKGAVDLDLPPWQRGRYGTAIGRAVHGVLQFADLATASDVHTLSLAQAAAEGVLGHESTIEALARSALQSATVRTATLQRHWRELFVATSVGAYTVEGYIDLLVRNADGTLVVVDYKTDQLGAVSDADERRRKYGLQLATYGIALEQLLGEPVVGGVLIFCRAGEPAAEVNVGDWELLKQFVVQRLGSAA